MKSRTISPYLPATYDNFIFQDSSCLIRARRNRNTLIETIQSLQENVTGALEGLVPSSLQAFSALFSICFEYSFQRMIASYIAGIPEAKDIRYFRRVDMKNMACYRFEVMKAYFALAKIFNRAEFNPDISGSISCCG